MVNLSCWGRCDEPCEEGAALVRAGRAAGRSLPPGVPRGSSGAAAAPPPPPHFPGAAPALASCPPPASPREAEGVGAPGATPSLSPPGRGGAFQGLPFLGGRVRPLPSLQSARRGGTARPRKPPSPSGGARPPCKIPFEEGLLSAPEIFRGGPGPQIPSSLPPGRALPGGMRRGSTPTPRPRKQLQR